VHDNEYAILSLNFQWYAICLSTIGTQSNTLITTLNCNLKSKVNLYFEIKVGDYNLTENHDYDK